MLSTKNRVTGAVIGKDTASLNVWVDRESTTVADYLRDALKPPLSVADSAAEIPGAPNSRCNIVGGVAFRSEIVPDFYDIDTRYLCQTGRRLIVISVTRHEGDPYETTYQTVARRVAESLRFSAKE